MLGSARIESRSLGVSRGELFASIYILGCANGLLARAVQSIHGHGWLDAAVDTFDVSIIVLVACLAGLSLILVDRTGEVRTTDLVLSSMLLLLIALPIGATSWLAVTILSLYVLVWGQAVDSRRRGAIILLAVTVPMLWSRLIFNLFARFILELDAILVGWVLGTNRTGNVVEFADHSGSLAIFPGCSSFANVSLALLCWVAVSQYVEHKWRPQDIFWCFLACLSVVAVNVLRISLMGINESHYLMLHSPPAEILLSIVMLSLVVSISLAGTRHDAIFHA
jgi:hypothetical protein